VSIENEYKVLSESIENEYKVLSESVIRNYPKRPLVMKSL